MKRSIPAFLTLILVAPALPQSPRIVTAAEANGTYRYRENEIRILALGHNRLRVQMALIHPYKSPMGPTANTGDAAGEATIDHETAVFYPMDDHKCRITLKFLPGNKLKVTEENNMDCGFGNNVSSAGTYTKIKSGKPKFDEDK